MLEKLRELNLAVINVDLTVLTEAPRLAPLRPAMRQRLADLLGLPLARVNIKATTTEKLGFIGRGEGLMAQAVVLLEACA